MFGAVWPDRPGPPAARTGLAGTGRTTSCPGGPGPARRGDGGRRSRSRYQSDRVTFGRRRARRQHEGERTDHHPACDWILRHVRPCSDIAPPTRGQAEPVTLSCCCACLPLGLPVVHTSKVYLADPLRRSTRAGSIGELPLIVGLAVDDLDRYSLVVV